MVEFCRPGHLWHGVLIKLMGGALEVHCELLPKKSSFAVQFITQ